MFCFFMATILSALLLLPLLSQVSWLKNGANMNLIPGTSGRISMLITHELVLSEMMYSDTGTYTCEASNINGEAFNRTYLTVIGE